MRTERVGKYDCNASGWDHKEEVREGEREGERERER